MSKQSPPAPTASAVGPCPTFIQVNRTSRRITQSGYYQIKVSNVMRKIWKYPRDVIQCVRSSFCIDNLVIVYFLQKKFHHSNKLHNMHEFHKLCTKFQCYRLFGSEEKKNSFNHNNYEHDGNLGQ